MENKEAVQKLITYYRKQDIEVIYYLLANAQVDFNRIDNINDLSDDEKINLMTRIKLNSSELRNFLRKENNNEPLTYNNIE